MLFINAISSALKPLRPICIYLKRANADEAIAFAKKVKGKNWADRIDKLLQRPGYENFFKHRFELELKLLPGTEHLICPVREDNWDNAKQMITD